MAVSVKQKFRFGPFVLNVHSGELYKNDYKLKVQPQPIQVLTILLERPGELVTRDELQKRIWPSDTFVDFEHGLNTAVKKLRQALSDESDTPKFIETLPRRGYRFIGEVEVNKDTGLAEVPPRRVWLPVTLSLLILVSAIISVGYNRLSSVPPRITSSEKLTNTWHQKITTIAALCSIATDGSRVYFQEHRGLDQWFFSQVSTSGGDTSDISPRRWSRPCLYGISPSGSDMLAVECCPEKFWSIPLPAGPPRLLNLPEGARWATWMPNGRNILFSFNGDKDLYRASLDDSAQRVTL